MEDQLKRTYGEDITSSASSSSLSNGSSMGAKSQSNKIGGIGSSSSRPNSLNIKVKEEPTYFQQGPSEEYLQPSEEYVYPCDDREFSGYESEFDQLTGESDYDEPQIDQSEQEDYGIYYQHGMNQRQQSFYSQRPPLRGRGGYSQRPVSHNRYGQRPQFCLGQQTTWNPYRNNWKRRGASGPMRCHICKDTTHLVKDCKYNKFSGHSSERGKMPSRHLCHTCWWEASFDELR